VDLRLSILVLVVGCGPKSPARPDAGAAETSRSDGALAGPRAPDAPDPAARLVREALELPVRSGEGFWGISPPAECVLKDAEARLIRFDCPVDLERLARFFTYYYPTLRRVERPGGLTFGGGPGEATLRAFALGPESRDSRLWLERPAGAEPDVHLKSVIEQRAP
jgi:hypothetical protein